MEGKKLTNNHKTMLKRRGFNPDDYVVIRELYSSVWFKNIRTGQVKVLNKHN